MIKGKPDRASIGTTVSAIGAVLLTCAIVVFVYGLFLPRIEGTDPDAGPRSKPCSNRCALHRFPLRPHSAGRYPSLAHLESSFLDASEPLPPAQACPRFALLGLGVSSAFPACFPRATA
jgi:hypothetical protein